MRLVYLFTTFPVLTETFYQREVRALKAYPVSLELHSLWGGEPRFEGLEVRRFALLELLTLAWWLPYWTVRRPRVIARTLGRLALRPPASPTNLGETLLGLGFGLVRAADIARCATPDTVMHAAWATMPGTAAQLISALVTVPFTLGAHAYDVFEGGGDWLLSSKLRECSGVVTSTEACARHLAGLGVAPERVTVVRRGLDTLPPPRPPRPVREPVRLLSVGRLVPKKGFDRQLEILAAIGRAGIAFEARIVGGGPLERRLRQRIADLGLEGRVTLTGAVPNAAVFGHFEWADLCLFTGIVAPSGDRDGLPNVVPEAMATGVVVIANAEGAVSEAVSDGESGRLLALDDTQAWIDAVRRLVDDDALFARLSANARAWVLREFDARINAGRVLEAIRGYI